MGVCVFCEGEVPVEKGRILKGKAINTLKSCSRQRKDHSLLDKIEGATTEHVIWSHNDCYRNYTRKQSINSSLYNKHDKENVCAPPPPKRRSQVGVGQFIYDEQCVFCTQKTESKHGWKTPSQYRRSVHHFLQKNEASVKQKIIAHALVRGDEEADYVRHRVDCNLFTKSARYHSNCYTSFFKINPQQLGDKSNKDGSCRKGAGRPEDDVNSTAFGKLCAEIEEERMSQYSLKELSRRMETLVEGQSGYNFRWLKIKLKEKYGEDIYFTEQSGLTTAVCFREKTNNILYNEWNMRSSSTGDNRIQLIEDAARIVREDIRGHVCDTENYNSNLFDQTMVPDSLRNLLTSITITRDTCASANRKREAIAHSVMSLTRPRSFLSPILLAVGVYVHRKQGSKLLIDILHSLGFSASYAEVQNYVESAIAATDVEETLNGFTQFVFDNADFNTNTLDGNNTFHSMGGIVIETPKPQLTSTLIPRLQFHGKFNSGKSIKIRTYVKSVTPGLSGITILPVHVNVESQAVSRALALDHMWMASFAVETPLASRPAWNGYMKAAFRETADYEVSDVRALPFIRLDPGNPSCIYSALLYAEQESRKAKQDVCFVTFDQALYQKAVEIVASAKTSASGELATVTVRLGGFHLTMSMMGAIGHIMSGSGLEELWSTVYAKGSIPHMMSGHAYARAIRAHILSHLALGVTMLQHVSKFDEALKSEVARLHHNLFVSEISPLDASNSPVLLCLEGLIQECCKNLSVRSRTAALWIQYFQQIDLVRMFIRAERSGDWELHFEAIRRMLPHFHAAAHLNYAKSARLYIQQMAEITEDMHQYLSVRRSNAYWCGVSTDLTIEQDLMRQLKSAGGLTRGRGITNSTLDKWVYAAPACAPLCRSLEDFSGVRYSSSEQHVELRASRQARDQRDLNRLVAWLECHPPFAERPADQLVSLSTGLVADSSINCEKAVEVGMRAMDSIIGGDFGNLKLRRNDKVKPLAAMTKTVVVRQKEVEINTQTLFNRMLILGPSQRNLRFYLSFELTAKPPSLFDEVSLRKNVKSALAQVFEKRVKNTAALPQNGNVVVDGGYLLHTCAWPYPATYREVCNVYVSHVQKWHSPKATVVFDGYEGVNTKSEEHKRRGGKNTSADLAVEYDTSTSCSRDSFLGNSSNKTGFIKLLRPVMEAAGLSVLQADGDADCLIVSEALQLAAIEPTTVVATDTDVLVLLVAHAREGNPVFQKKPGKANQPASVMDISLLQEKLKEQLRTTKILLFLHAVTGCDTTSGIYGKSKAKALEIVEKSAALAAKVEVFLSPTASTAKLLAVGEEFLLRLYGDSKCKTLDELRFEIYAKKVGKTKLGKKFKMETLPPTSAAAEQHLLRTYLQVQEWCGNRLNPTDWGWYLSEQGSLIPVPTLKPPAPEKLLHLISCNCKKGCKGSCECKRAAMLCTAMCGYCQGHDCANSAPISMEDEE